jgi:hypothetical protein
VPFLSLARSLPSLISPESLLVDVCADLRDPDNYEGLIKRDEQGFGKVIGY